MRQETFFPDGTLISVEEVADEMSEHESARQSALDKLKALGLTEAEALALVGSV